MTKNNNKNVKKVNVVSYLFVNSPPLTRDVTRFKF